MASTAFSTLPNAVMMITGRSGLICLALSKRSMPDMPGILTSDKTRSMAWLLRISRASIPLDAVNGVYPSSDRISPIIIG